MSGLKIQFLNGGLANQTFQYIFARYYELSHPGEIMYLDDSYFATHTVHNGYELEKVFGVKPHMISECFDPDVWNEILEQRRQGLSLPQILKNNGLEIEMIAETDTWKDFNPFDGEIYVYKDPQNVNSFCPDILAIDTPIYYHGYWINKGWFEAYKYPLLNELHFPAIQDERNLQYLVQIQTTNSVSLHVRRGDFVTIDWALSSTEYREFVEDFLANAPGTWHVFVFSDDIDWCKANEKELGLTSFEEITYIEGNTDGKNYIDLQLMSSCKAMIMSNSSFCFLAALLNTHKEYVLNNWKRQV